MDDMETNQPFLTDIEWKRDYRTSSRDDVDILEDFYVPLLDRAVEYDRVAGYFRSSSLKLAFRGFGSFARRGGKARFIVGADMDARDVAVLTADHDQVLVEILDREIDTMMEDQKPSREPTGFELLAWMVWKGVLEIRVAVVERGRTSRDRFDGRDFSYAHEKWAVVKDASGNRLGFAGSLNESRTALELNAENISVFCGWHGEDPSKRIHDMTVDFDHLWDGNHDTIKVVGLPDAIKQKLVSIAPRVDRLLRRVAVAQSIEVSEQERERWWRLINAPRSREGRFLGMSTCPITPWPHQEFVARRIVETYPRSMIIADEVGLGKTIEIGAAIRELILSGRASRILILPPATLTKQWQIEMKEKFLLSFTRAIGQKKHDILDEEGNSRTAPYTQMFAPDLLIVSAQTFAGDYAQGKFQAAEEWDLIVIDEAHYATNGQDEPDELPGTVAWYQRNGDTLLRKAIRQQASRRSPALLLATATPMQVRKKQAYDLMRLTELGGSFLRSDGTSDAYYAAVMRMKGASSIREDDEILLRAFAQEVRHHDEEYFAFCMTFYAREMSQDFISWLDGKKQYRKVAPTPSRRSKMSVILHAMAPLSRVMTRHGRALLRQYKEHGLLEAGLATRHVSSESIRMDPGEVDAYGRLEEYCASLKKTLERHAPADQRKKAVGQTNFFLSFLRLRFASSTFAAWETVKRRVDRVEQSLLWLESNGLDRTPAVKEDEEEETVDLDDREDDPTGGEQPLPNRSTLDLVEEKDLLKALVDSLGALKPAEKISSKDRRLLDILDPRHNVVDPVEVKQTIVFTRFGDTMRHLLVHLRGRLASVPMATFSGAGGMFYPAGASRGQPVSRTDVKDLFLAGKVFLLVCTDAAAEGLNLQVADLLVNFDLPWNPAKVEQRIGRIDRIGQKHEDIYVSNMAYDGSAELEVYSRLLERLDDANLIVGSQQISLLPITVADFEKLADVRLPQAERESILERAEQEAKEVSRIYSEREMDVVELAKIHAGLQQEWRAEAAWSLDDAWQALRQSDYLRTNGAKMDGEEFVVPSIGEINRTEIRFTRDGKRYDRGGVSFASWGDPDFDRLAQLLSDAPQFELVQPPQRQEQIRSSRQRADLHWHLAAAHETFLADVVADFTRREDPNASKAQRKNAIADGIGDKLVKQIRPDMEKYGWELPSMIRWAEDRSRVIVPTSIIEVASEEVL